MGVERDNIGGARPRRLHNPFPRPPPGLQFVRGHLHFALTSRSLAAGKNFLVSWDANQGVLAVHHRRDLDRALWTTPRQGSFVAAAWGESTIHESHGSITLHDHADLVFSHQTIEDIALSGPSNHPCSDSKPTDPDGTPIDHSAPVVLVTGCLYSTCELASDELWRFHNGNRRETADSPFHESGDERTGNRLGVRYRLIFSQRRDHQLGFHVELDAPVRMNGDSRPHIRSSIRFAETSRSWKLSSSSRWLQERNENRSAKRVDVDRTSVLVPRLNRVMLSYTSHAGERFYGFGEQFSCFDMKGKRVPILVQEQGLGRGDQPITAAANLVAYRAGGDWHTTYAPAPHYLTSDMNSLFLEGYEHSVFDLTQHDCVQVQVHAGDMKGRILYGRTPSELIKEYTAAVGRMRELPAWITKGAIVGMQGGSDAVRKVWRKLHEHDVPLSAFWLQDWVGQRKTSVGWQLWWNWEVDRDHYPGWEELIAEMKSHGVRTMAYLNPFIVAKPEVLSSGKKKDDLFTEAVEQRYVVADRHGAPYMMPITSFDAATLDLTNPETRRWFKRLMHAMVTSGVHGWMADFGESLPFDSCLHSGEDPATAHNRYPELWAELNREFVEEWEQEKLQDRARAAVVSDAEGLNGDLNEEGELVFFMRAGYRGSPRWATLFWEGDQMVSWQRHDGIKSAVTGLLSSGISGFSLNHSDVGGYCTVDVPLLGYRRTEELLLRWMELNAFSVIFRSHEGNVPNANVQLYSNDTTLRHFARCAKIYKAWEFYRRQLVKEAAAVGMPVVRHLFLHYPEDQYVQTLVYQQFLVGSEMLVVPVLDKGHTQVQAYFPAGDQWEHIWTGALYPAAADETHKNLQGLKAWVQAPLGFPAVFVKSGSWVGQQFMHNLVKEKLEMTWPH